MGSIPLIYKKMENKYKNYTNTEFVTELMEGYNDYGALAQMVMIEAIEKGLNVILEHKDEVIEEYKQQKAEGKFHFINLEAWMNCTEQLLDKFNTKYST